MLAAVRHHNQMRYLLAKNQRQYSDFSISTYGRCNYLDQGIELLD